MPGDATTERPGEPLVSGFTWRPANEAEMSPEARARVLTMIEASTDARRRAAAAARTAVIG